jgi:hypothetical protein
VGASFWWGWKGLGSVYLLLLLLILLPFLIGGGMREGGREGGRVVCSDLGGISHL